MNDKIEFEGEKYCRYCGRTWHKRHRCQDQRLMNETCPQCLLDEIEECTCERCIDCSELINDCTCNEDEIGLWRP